MSRRYRSNIINPSQLDLYTRGSTANQAAYEDCESQVLLDANKETANSSSTTNVDFVVTPQDIAVKHAGEAKERLAIAHEGLALAARALSEAGVFRQCDCAAKEMKEFGDAICGRYAAATFLWRVLQDMPVEDWFGPGKKFDDTLRRLRTLKGLEASLGCWEKLVLELIDLAEEKSGQKGMETLRHDVSSILGRWQRGMPKTP
ncbi:hypothetical protein VTI74DRAFT_11143 [Chaetomium olivicolor]